MGTLDRLTQLQQEGRTDEQAIGILRSEGFQMTEISDALAQSKIKNAVSQEPEQTQEYQNQASGQDYYSPPQEGYNYQPPQQDYPSPQQYSPQQYDNYSGEQYGGGYYAQQGNTDTMTDIAEQVVNKKIQELSKILERVVQLTNSSDRELNDLKEKVKRIESNLDSIQKAIIGKIGEFGESTKLVQKDLENIHGTMSKMMNPLIDNYNELKKFNSKKQAKN